ncbi:hypothetical protein WR25_16423 [Diploscapter pachys]|uniref:Uncharacterized protein n=1 Tax=Diploscapter pachys TaxID=2018661 RepID=A0A2A2K771_9BILA|nr:hypothetical protein WR25_16423 [Diploscapter pachys]
MVAMLQFLSLEISDRVRQFGVAVAQFVTLLLIVFVDLGLDRRGAGHRRIRPDRRSDRTQCEARLVPERLEQRRPHAAARHHRIEEGAVPLLLGGHMMDRARRRVPIAQHRQLARIDTRRTIFARLIDADHRLRRLAPVAGAPVRPARVRDRRAKRSR